MLIHRAKRSGFSLLEVIVALVIFLMAIIAVSQLINLGADLASEASDNIHATQLCQAKMGEVIAGVVSMSSQSDMQIEDESDWTWSLDCEQANVTGLWTVTVKVSRNRPDGSKIECTLQQMVIDPGTRGSSFDMPTANSSSSSSGGQTGAPSTGTSGGNP